MTRIYREMWEESGAIPKNNVKTETKKKFFNKITVQSAENGEMGKNYFTVFSKEELFDNVEQKNILTSEIGECLKFFFKKYGVTSQSKILVVGLGNEKVTADSLGSRVNDKLIITSHVFSDIGIRSRYGNLCAMKSSVSGVTGIESFELISSAVRAVKPDLIVAVDTLSCGNSERLGKTIQITDAGIEPGAGVNNPKKKLSYDSLKVPLIAIGVPFVIYVRTILNEYGVSDKAGEIPSLVVTAKDIDFLIEDYSDVISSAINKTVHG